MKKVYLGVLTVLLTVCAMAVSVTQWGMLNCMRERKNVQIRGVPDLTANLSSEQLEKERNLARWYNYHLYREPPGKEVYETLMDFGEGIMGFLILPGMEQVYPIVHASSSDENSAVHCYGTALPVGGRGNCTVLRFGGNGLSVGDVFRIHILDTMLTYQVTEQGNTLPGITEEDLCVLSLISATEASYVIAVRVDNPTLGE